MNHPLTVNSFAFLAQKNYFDKTACHRLSVAIRRAPARADRATSSPTRTRKVPHTRRTPSPWPMRAPGTNGSRFFRVFGDSRLPPDYTVFGNTTHGIDLLETGRHRTAPGGGGRVDGGPPGWWAADGMVAGRQGRRRPSESAIPRWRYEKCGCGRGTAVGGRAQR
ncbi:peptidylprolyl isomerase [Streptomyces sp. NPDC005409]|uniref:peptidylprolyl isomerase n=1 Tax=Streptomyces sp. NPDC005409 TaxID=3155342 RepID=UPI003454940D